MFGETDNWYAKSFIVSFIGLTQEKRERNKILVIISAKNMCREWRSACWWLQAALSGLAWYTKIGWYHILGKFRSQVCIDAHDLLDGQANHQTSISLNS